MDKVIIEDLHIFAYHGVLPEEKAKGQTFIISLTVFLDLSKAADSDDLSSTINYAALCEDIQEVFTQKKHDLIETAAMSIILMIFKKYRIADEVEVFLKKPNAPIRQKIGYAAVKIRRKRVDIHG
jgi:dihydroneopterin aldolase